MATRDEAKQAAMNLRASVDYGVLLQYLGSEYTKAVEAAIYKDEANDKWRGRAIAFDEVMKLLTGGQ